VGGIRGGGDPAGARHAADRRLDTTLLARVIHVRPEQDGEWLLGCRLAKDFVRSPQAMLRETKFN